MPWKEVMKKFKEGNLHSGSKTGKKVTDPGQAKAIMLSEKEKAEKGKKEYQSPPKKKSKLKERGFKSLPSALGKKDKLGSVPLGGKMMGRK